MHIKSKYLIKMREGSECTSPITLNDKPSRVNKEQKFKADLMQKFTK